MHSHFAKKRFASATLMILSLGLGTSLFSGCGGGASDSGKHEAHFQSIVNQTNQLSDAFDRIKDAKTANVESLGIVSQCDMLSQTLAESNSLPDLGAMGGMALKSRFEDHWQAELEKAFQRLEKSAKDAKGRVGNLPVLRQVETRMKQLQGSLQAFEEGYVAAFSGE